MDEKSIEAAAVAYDDYWEGRRNHKEAMRAAIAAYRDAEIERLTALCATLQQQAEIHAIEARGANASLAECYRAVTGGTGEPGNWHGAKPVVNEIADLRAKLEAAERDAERYRWLRENRLWLKANLPMLAAQEFDAGIDSAMRDYYAARGGERG